MRAPTELYRPMLGRFLLYVLVHEADVSLLGQRRPDIRVLSGNFTQLYEALDGSAHSFTS